MLQCPRPSTTQTNSWLQERPAGPASQGGAAGNGNRTTADSSTRLSQGSRLPACHQRAQAASASKFLVMFVPSAAGAAGLRLPVSAHPPPPWAWVGFDSGTDDALRARLRRPGRGRELGRSAVDHAVHSAVQAPHGGRIRGVAGRGSPLRHCEAGRRALREELERGADGACRSGRGRGARTPAAACCCGSLVRLDTALSARRASHVRGMRAGA